MRSVRRLDLFVELAKPILVSCRSLRDVGSAHAIALSPRHLAQWQMEASERKAELSVSTKSTPLGSKQPAVRLRAKVAALTGVLVSPSTTLARNGRGAARPRALDRGGRGRLVGAPLPEAAARRDLAPHPPGRIPLGLYLLGDRGGGGRAHTVGVRHRIGDQPRGLRQERRLRLPEDGAARPHPRRARTRGDHARRPRGCERRGPVVAPRASRGGRVRQPRPCMAVVRSLRRHHRAHARPLRGRAARRRGPASRLRPDLAGPQHRRGVVRGDALCS